MKRLISTLAFASLALPTFGAEQGEPRPNVLLIMADDLLLGGRTSVRPP